MKRPPRQSGFSLVSALFLLVVFGSLGAYMVSISGTQHYTPVLALQGSRAYFIARGGIDWGVSAATNSGACVNSPAGGLNGGNLSGFVVTVTCTSTSHLEAGSTINIFTVTSVATTITPAFGQAGYASRRITAIVTDAP